MLSLLPRPAPSPITCLSPPSFSTSAVRTLASRRAAALADAQDPADPMPAARHWLATLSSSSIPRHICDVSFSRSGGPGGQNVNKVNSKATLKVPLSALLPLVPPVLHQPLRSSRYLADRTQCLVIQSDESRKQAANVESCFEKLHMLLRATAKDSIPGETSQDQKDRVQKLKKAENESRLKTKKMLSSKKSSRRGSNYDD